MMVNQNVFALSYRRLRIRVSWLVVATIVSVSSVPSVGMVAAQDDVAALTQLYERLDEQQRQIDELILSRCDESEQKPSVRSLDYYVGFDNGWVVRSFDTAEHPFEIKLNGWAQFRHHGFVRASEAWTDNAGITRPVRNRNAFDIERARLVLSGSAVDPRLTYFVQIDGDTDEGHTLDFFDYWFGWQLTDGFQLQIGKRKVTASRQWLLGARDTRFADRPMANDFFRPDRTLGIFGVGKFGDHGHYELMLGNGYRTANLPNSATDNRFTFAATSHIDPAGNYGSQIVDFEDTENALWRLGHSFVYSPQTSQQDGVSLAETDFLRLSDGTLLTQVGAIDPGVTVSDFDVLFYGVDLAWKRQGWSMTSEVFLRRIDDIRGNGPLSRDDLLQHGFYVEGGKFLLAKRLDFNLRYSRIDGHYGDSNEYAAGTNWYPLSKRQWKITFDVTRIDASPLQNTTSDILVGDDGTLFRTQFQAEF